MNAVLLTSILFGMLVLFLLTGLPLSFSLSAAAVILILWQLGPEFLYLIPATAYSAWTNFILVAVPLFVLMANFLAESGIAGDLYEAMYKWMGRLRGGLAMGTVIICAIFGAMSGISGVATVSMGLIALPSMLERRYQKSLAIGSVAAGGTLAILIPPSIIMIIYGSLAGESVGKLFLAGIIPGIILTFIFVCYIGIRSFLQPAIAPGLSKKESYSWKEKMRSIKSLSMPLVLIILVLGVIYTGVCTPTEASGIGAFGALICLIIKKRATWEVLSNALLKTLRLTCMIMWIVLGAKLFSHVYYAIGSIDLITNIISGIGLNRWFILIIMELIMIILGMFLDPMGIIVICIPIFLPIIQDLGFNTLWFGILFVINMEIGYITPPFGFNLFYMKGVVPVGVTMGDIYRSIVPFFMLDLFMMAILMVFPQLSLWLPSKMG